MSILCWNCRGAASPDIHQDISDLVRDHRPMMLYLLETRLPGHRVEEIKTWLGYDGVHTIDSVGLSGGIWMLWDKAVISVDIMPHGNQAIHALVKVVE